MSAEDNTQVVKNFFAAIGHGDKDALKALVSEDLEWILPGKDWPLAGTRRGHAGLAEQFRLHDEGLETNFIEAREFVAQGDRVMVIGYAEGRILATDKHFKDDWVFAITVRDGKITYIREYIDTQALADASRPD